MFLLDTNAVSETRQARMGRGNPAVLAWIGAQRPETMYLSVMTIFEIERGIRRLERRDPRQSVSLRGWMTGFLRPAFGDRVLPVDEEVAMVAAAFHVSNPASMIDSLIAATALVHRLTVVTRNVRDFGFPGVAILNPWE